MNLMVSLVNSLFESKFLIHALAISRHNNDFKWHDISRLPNEIHHRLNLLFISWKKREAALIYFTGNDIFNRSLRLLASKKRMDLNQRGLFKDTLRESERVKIVRGTCITSESKEEIFKILEISWRLSRLRNCWYKFFWDMKSELGSLFSLKWRIKSTYLNEINSAPFFVRNSLLKMIIFYDDNRRVKNDKSFQLMISS